MSNIDAHAQDVQLKLTDALTALQACQTAISGAKSAIVGSEPQAGASTALMQEALDALAPFAQRFSDMINGIVDANAV